MKNPKTGEFRPSPSLVKRARRYLSHYKFMIQPDGEGGFLGSAVELPGVIAEGDTLDSCARNLSFSLETVIASYLADGQTPPAPAAREKRTEQINVRFTPAERAALQQQSMSQGFRGVGDLIRAEMVRLVQPATHRKFRSA